LLDLIHLPTNTSAVFTGQNKSDEKVRPFVPDKKAERFIQIMKASSSLLLYIFAFCMLRFSSVSRGVQVFNDDFSDPTLSASFWKLFPVGVGPSLAQQNGRVEISVPASSHGSGNSGPTFGPGSLGVGYNSREAAVGDFDFQVDFALLNWPNENGIRMGIGLDLLGTAVERASFAPHDFAGFGGEFYLTDFFDHPDGITPTAEQAGKLRLVRSGSVLSGYYWNGQSWVLIHEGPGPDLTGHIFLGVFSDDQFFQKTDVALALDNFQFKGNLTNSVPEASTPLSNVLASAVCFSALFVFRSRLLAHVKRNLECSAP